MTIENIINDIIRDLRYLLSLTNDINQKNEEIEYTTDPYLLMTYKEELTEMLNEFHRFEEVLEEKIKFYLELSEKRNEPYELAFFKILKEIKKHRSNNA
jgi:hypothetical protein